MFAGGREVGVVELDGARLCALAAEMHGGRVIVKRWHSVRKPDSIAMEDAESLGAWIGAELKAAGVPRRKVVLCIPRGDVVLKTITLPKPAPGPKGEAELAGMVRLQMVRQLTLSAEGTPIDFVPILEEATKDGVPNLTVLAGAMPGDRAAWWDKAADAGGFKVTGIALRGMGAAAMLAEQSQRLDGPVLGVSIGPATTELVVVEQGKLMFARSVEVARPEADGDLDAFAERLAVEAKRTWIGYRSGRPGPDLEMVGVLGTDPLDENVSQRCGSVLEVRGATVSPPRAVEIPASVPAGERSLLTTVVGVLYDTAQGRATLDFANPRKAPDLSARKRQLALAGVFGVIMIGGVAYVLADQRLGDLRNQLSAAQAKEKEVQGDLDQFLVDHARLNHLEQWRACGIDWIAHAKLLAERSPDPGVAQFGEFAGSMTGTPSFSVKTKYPDGTWTHSQAATIKIGGRVSARQVASDLRDALIDSGVYAVQNTGADFPDRFNLVLQTQTADPTPETPAPAAPRPDQNPEQKSGRKAGTGGAP